jgi:hypothetical protein
LHPEGGYCSECEDYEDGFPPPKEEDDKPKTDVDLDKVMESLKRIEKAVALLAEEALTDVPDPDKKPEEN